ncbi:hypothetical protein [Acidipila rosea]|uniref:Adhesin n=1 Tax=Acidipila rosea TaxID=768535 RepID=A0A4R1LEF6_9BACT|nr:hypothetical protein [Acidipila rosea]TCK75203.1 hypothetical protein C7378_0183 [Acidipila rosea]
MKQLCAAAIGLLLAAAPAFGVTTTTGNMQCDHEPVSPRIYQPQAGDQAGAQSLTLTRAFTGKGKLELSVCDGTVRVRPAKSPGQLGLSVEFGSRPEDGRTVADYIQKLEVGAENADLQLKFPPSLHAVVTLTVPPETTNSQFNLGDGDFDIDAARIGGDRQFNLGHGHAKLLVHGDASYATLQVNIGMGSLHDHRPSGHDGHFIVSRSYGGTGKGSLQVNLGAGSVDISQE